MYPTRLLVHTKGSLASHCPRRLLKGVAERNPNKIESDVVGTTYLKSFSKHQVICLIGVLRSE